MEFYLVSDSCSSTGSVSESKSFRRQVESRKYNTFMSVCYIFHLTLWVTFVKIVGIDVIIGILLKYNDVFFSKINIH